MSQWLDISTAPKDKEGPVMLLRSMLGNVQVGYWDADMAAWTPAAFRYGYDPVKWMPIPQDIPDEPSYEQLKAISLHNLKRRAALHEEVEKLRANLKALKTGHHFWALEYLTEGDKWIVVGTFDTRARARSYQVCGSYTNTRIRKYVRLEP